MRYLGLCVTTTFDMHFSYSLARNKLSAPLTLPNTIIFLRIPGTRVDPKMLLPLILHDLPAELELLTSIPYLFPSAPTITMSGNPCPPGV